jgi:ribosome-binding protein aMBF1 (putative translation factor)
MITNQRQYKITQKMHPVKRKMHEDALRSQLEDLQEELAAYEQLQEGRQSPLPVDSLDGLAVALIQARIASGWTQRQLAERLGIKEQQVQRYEATRYSAASLERLREVMDALGMTVQGELIRRAA